MKSFRKMCRGEKGFTLIELLVVIIILGVLAAVVTLAVTRFIGKGVLESANAEVVTLQAAIESALAEGTSAEFAGIVANWDGSDLTSPYVDVDDSGAYNAGDIRVYDQMRTHKLKAHYTIAVNGDITGADLVFAGSWGASKIDWCQASVGFVAEGAACP